MFQTLVKIGFYDGVVFGIICCCFGDFFKFGACWKWKKDNKKGTIILCHIQLVIRNDEELGKLLASVTITHGRMLPNIHSMLSFNK
jgi:hypothetical protein